MANIMKNHKKISGVCKCGKCGYQIHLLVAATAVCKCGSLMKGAK